MTDTAERGASASLPAQAGAGRPASAVSEATGLVGVAAGGLFVAVSLGSDIAPEVPALLLVAILIGSMALWSVLVERVHRNPTTGLDFSAPRPVDETVATTRVKLAGLYATWAAIGLVYFAIRTYRAPGYEFYFGILTFLAPLLVLAGAAYVFHVDRHMREPRDALWHAGQWVLGRPCDREMVAEHCRAWAIKGYFLALMVADMPGQLGFVIGPTPGEAFADPVSFALWAIEAMFLFDVTYALLGYIVTLRVLDSHIRSSNPYLAAWVFALVCYAPFLVMGTGGPLDYRGEVTWTGWLAGSELVLALWGGVLVALTAVYAWATVIFGLRFSNLTHRGILTNGPFRFFRHPAYLTKNIFWWMVFMPFLSVAGPADAFRNCLMLLGVNFIYYMRAKTEEWHLMEDPDYRAYSAWIAEYGVLARLRRALTGRRGG